MVGPADDHPGTGAAGPDTQERKGDSSRTAWGWITEFILEFVGEGILQLLAGLLLAGVATGVYWGWQHSAVLTSGAIAVLVVAVAAVAAAWRHPAPLRVRRLGVALVTVLGLLALLFLLYGTNCGCLSRVVRSRPVRRGRWCEQGDAEVG